MTEKKINTSNESTKIGNEKKVNSNELVFGMEVWKIRALLPVLGVVLVIIISFGLLVLPKINQISDYRKLTSDLVARTTDVKQKISYLNSADESTIKAREDVLLMALPESKDIHFVLNVISDISSQYGFSVDSFSLVPGELVVTEGEERPELEKMPFSVTMIGPSDRYIELVEGIENMLPILAITDLDSRSVSSTLLEIKLSLVTNFFLSETVVDMKKLTYKELVINEKELELLDRLSGFRQPTLTTTEQSNAGTGFVEYPVNNPFQSAY